MLNLTVAVGTLNVLIFYTNIVASNFSIFFPFSSPNFITVFISWLNLDIGIDTCFFRGMDAYWKVWIDLLFPAYLISLVILVIFITCSEEQQLLLTVTLLEMEQQYMLLTLIFLLVATQRLLITLQDTMVVESIFIRVQCNAVKFAS